MRHFTSLHERGAEGVSGLVEAARRLKAAPPKTLPLAGKSVGLCFMNPSLRTQTSFEVAAASLGAHPVTLMVGQGTWKLEAADGAVMDGDKPEHVREAVPVLARFCQALGLRSFPEGRSWAEDSKDPMLSAFKRLSSVPVFSMESALGHPCQALADQMTIAERMRPAGKKLLLTWAPHIKALPLAVPHSTAEMAALSGMDLTIARPEGYDLDPAVMERVRAACAAHGRKLTVTDDVEAAYEGAHVVYAKSWGSLASYGTPPPADPAFRARWMVTEEKLARSAKALFMHCLPVRRNLVVEDAVLDGPRSVVVDQAENRLHTAKAVLLDVLGQTVPQPQEASCRIPS
ncbi:MAG: N-acetylornithine carbamoyltransferase [Elusimicrobia bacterium]|nr:N-acetylornithine carbamoyltransferase [Elusimicrobiota bacterium]